jgi:DNA-binding response OmpR family regulator
VLILTARGYALDQEDLRIGNIKGVLSKPFSPRAVLQLVKETLTAARGGQTAADADTGKGAGRARDLDTDTEAA